MKRKKKNKNLFISIVVPAYKQEKTIRKDLLRIKKVLDQLRHSYELIVVVDGQLDKTYELAKKLSSKKIKIIGYADNRGKGYAIRYGVSKSKGNIIGFIDAGMDLNPNGLSMLLEHFEWYNADVIIGSKRHPVSKINYPLQRKILSFFSQIFIRLLFGLNVKDTQVGLKFFKRSVIKDVFPRLLVKKYAFDIEFLVVAKHLGYKRIFEAPVELDFKPEASLVSKSLFKVIVLTFLDVLAIFYRLNILNYYDNKKKKKFHNKSKRKI